MNALHTLRAGRPECPSDLQLDQLHANELTGAPAEAVRTHLQTCATCQTRMTERTQGFAGMPEVDERKLLAAIRRRAEVEPKGQRNPLLVWRWVGALVLPVAGLLMLLVMPRQTDETTRLKGGPALRVFKSVDGHGVEVSSGDTLHPGDALRFVVSLPHQAYVRIVNLDGSGQLSTAWPESPQATPIAAGDRIELEGAVSLDATPGDELFALTACESAEGLQRCASVASPREIHCATGCTVTPFMIHKVTP